MNNELSKEDWKTLADHFAEANKELEKKLKEARTNVPSDPEDPIFFTIDGKEHCREEQCLAQLLLDEVLFCNERKTVWEGWDGRGKEIEEPTTVLFVLCNDLFYWGTADAERLLNDEIGKLYKMHMADKHHGASKWCCLRRKLRPQVPIVEAWKKEGFWDDELEALPAPEPS